MLVSVPAQHMVQAPNDQLMHLSAHHMNRPHLHILRLRDLQTPSLQPSETVVGQAPSTLSVSRISSASFYSNALSHLNKEAVTQFNKVAPYLAICAVALRYSEIFNQRQQGIMTPQALAYLTPDQKRLYTLMQENTQLKERLKATGWQFLFSLAMLNPEFNRTYESIETLNDARNAINIFDPAHGPVALQHLTNRYVGKLKTCAISQMSKLLVLAYRRLIPQAAHPSLAKTALDVMAITSINTVISPLIVNHCTQPQGVVALFAREKALGVYNYFPETIKQKLVHLKNWFNQLSRYTQH